jgi:hypothetical protein
MRVVDLIRRLRDEFTAMPGLRLTTAQVGRLCSADAITSASALRALVSARFLNPMPDGRYGRNDLVTSAGMDPLAGRRTPIVPSLWRRSRCVVDRDTEGGNALSTTARSALRYAATLAITHRARITALQVIPQRSSEPASPTIPDEHRKGVSCERFHALIDVETAIGTPNEELARVRRRSTPT